ncbi:hypothetical protein RND71_043504 [Anisodus tanguticus]|uniref:Uncharacterized protein n=1 Tax=Anisodus tanguticus TaxID=243964 RepID=A0AAE1QPS1_9SOLA|nr:hypothetical protein RND71_043504 [Anisodus tanguticus]
MAVIGITSFVTDVDETKRIVEEYKKKNAEVTIKNCGKLSKDDILIDQLLEEEKEKEDLKKKWQQVEESNVKFNQMKKLQKEALVDELMYSNMSATQILESHVNDLKSGLNLENQNITIKNKAELNQMKQKLFEQEAQINRNKPSYFSTGIQRGKASNIFAPVPKDESKPYVYETRELELNGPKLPSIKELVNKKYLNNVRSTDEVERAGGFEPYYSCCRALLDAFCGLYFNNN